MPNHWTPYARKTALLEKKFFPSVKAVILDYRREVIAHLKAHGVHSAQLSVQSSPINPKIPLLLQSIYKSAGVMGARLQYDLLKQEIQSGKKGASFGRNELWIRNVQDYLKQFLTELALGITDTMRDDIIKILSDAVDQGLSIDQIIGKLTDTGLIEARARVIARTEINRAANVGHSIAAKEIPYEVNKQWISARDHRVRTSHQKANLQMVDEDATFKVGIDKGNKPTGQFDQMQFPGDHTAHLSNTVNCRCRVIYKAKRDANGNLILRDRQPATIIPMRRVEQTPIEQIAAILKAHATVTIK